MPLDADHNSKTFHVVGHRNTRPDGVDKVTGRAKYGADMTAPGMLHAKILRSPHAALKVSAGQPTRNPNRPRLRRSQPRPLPA